MRASVINSWLRQGFQACLGIQTRDLLQRKPLRYWWPHRYCITNHTCSMSYIIFEKKLLSRSLLVRCQCTFSTCKFSGLYWYGSFKNSVSQLSKDNMLFGMEGVLGAGFKVIKKSECSLLNVNYVGIWLILLYMHLLVFFCGHLKCIIRILHVNILLDVCPKGYSSDDWIEHNGLDLSSLLRSYFSPSIYV